MSDCAARLSGGAFFARPTGCMEADVVRHCRSFEGRINPNFLLLSG
jgi:hypothetical protein